MLIWLYDFVIRKKRGSGFPMLILFHKNVKWVQRYEIIDNLWSRSFNFLLQFSPRINF